MASFFITTDNWEKEEEFTLFDMGAGSSTMESAILEDIIFRKNQKFLYIFDFFNERGLFIEYVGEVEEGGRKELPACTNSKGNPPKQVIFGGKSRKLYNNIVVSDDDDDDIGMDVGMDMDDDDDLFLNGDDEDDDTSDFDDVDNISDEDED
jgi:hypothetical protein